MTRSTAGRDDRGPARWWVWTALALVAACGAVPAKTGGQEGEVFRVGGVELGVEDEIDGLDALVDAEGCLHLVWREVDRPPSGSGLPQYRGWYRACPQVRCAGSEGVEVLPWARPVAPRLVQAVGRVYAVDGRRLELFEVRGPTGEGGAGEPAAERRSPPEPLLGAGDPPALAFDLAGGEEGISVVYLSRRGEDRPWELYWLRWTTTEVSAPRRLLELPASALEPPPPRLLMDGRRLRLLVAANADGRRMGQEGAATVETFRPTASLFYLHSEDGGATWREPVEIRLEEGRPGPVQAVELLAIEPGVLASFSSGRLYTSVSADGGTSWPPARELTAEGRAGTVRAAGGALAWIDDRHRRSDRRWWKPLGGLPWSDSPEWANNDVLLAPVAAPRDLLGAGRGIAVRRVTPDLGYVGDFRLLAVESRLLAVWAGRSRVGKQRGSAGAPPEIFYRWLSIR